MMLVSTRRPPDPGWRAWQRCLLVSLGLPILIFLAACGGSDNSTDGRASSERSGIRIEFAMVGVPGDPFYNVLKNGARQAGEDLGVEVQYNETQQYDYQEQARLIRSTQAKQPDAMIVSDEKPEVLDPVIKEVVDAGIPVMITNVGDDSVDKTGALGFVGVDTVEVGRVVGEGLKARGVERPMCLNPAPGAVFSEQEIRGLRSVFGDAVSCIAADQTNRTAATNAIQNALQNSDADALLGLSITTDEPALKALEKSGLEGKVKIAGIDLSPTVLEAIKDRKMLFTSDQQQYLQGYLPVMFLALHKQYGFAPPTFTQTGPSLVTSDNVAEVIDLSNKGIR